MLVDVKPPQMTTRMRAFLLCTLNSKSHLKSNTRPVHLPIFPILYVVPQPLSAQSHRSIFSSHPNLLLKLLEHSFPLLHHTPKRPLPPNGRFIESGQVAPYAAACRRRLEPMQPFPLGSRTAQSQLT
eukprot:2662549-Pleurochrysis_carterae.AAC.2